MSKVARDELRERNTALLKEFRSKGCRLCPEKHPCCLTAHHLIHDEKLFSIGKCWKTVETEVLKAELAKCVCLCMNCHKKVHEDVLIV